jgi:hypothetical protein
MSGVVEARNVRGSSLLSSCLLHSLTNAVYVGIGVKRPRTSMALVHIILSILFTLVVLTDFQHPARRHHFPMAGVVEAVGNESCSYLSQNDAKRVLHSESRFLGSSGPSPSSFLVLNSLIAHRYHLATRAALFIAITRRSQRHDRHRRRHEERNMIVIHERTRARCLASVSTPPLRAWTLSELVGVIMHVYFSTH